MTDDVIKFFTVAIVCALAVFGLLIVASIVRPELAVVFFGTGVCP